MLNIWIEYMNAISLLEKIVIFAMLESKCVTSMKKNVTF